MRTSILFLSFLLLAACSSNDQEQGNTSNKSNTSTEARSPAPENPTTAPTNQAPQAKSSNPTLGERIDGPANIRESINGELLFSLDDHTLVSCTPLKNDWYKIGLLMDVEQTEVGTMELKKGQKIKLDGKEVGEIKADMKVYISSDGTQGWAELIGYTHKDNVKPVTIIENVLSDYIKTLGSERSTAQFQAFFQDFGMEKNEQFDGYTLYYNYENWIEDPSPMWRIGLVFQNNRLVSILHSRPLSIPGTSNHKLGRGFDCLTYDDVEGTKKIVKMFEDFVKSVD